MASVTGETKLTFHNQELKTLYIHCVCPAKFLQPEILRPRKQLRNSEDNQFTITGEAVPPLSLQMLLDLLSISGSALRTDWTHFNADVQPGFWRARIFAKGR